MGSNFVPANAINQLEMWQADTFDSQEIDKELGWAEELDMNTMRVFLHDLTAIQIAESDVISFHNYSWPEEFEKEVTGLDQYHRPLLCTEYMARSVGSTFDTILPIAKAQRVAALNWGFVAGKSQTYLPWDSWNRPYVKTQPTVWFHDVLHADGKPYRRREAQILRDLTGKSSRKTSIDRRRVSPFAVAELKVR